MSYKARNERVPFHNPRSHQKRKYFSADQRIRIARKACIRVKVLVQSKFKFRETRVFVLQNFNQITQVHQSMKMLHHMWKVAETSSHFK